MLKYAVHIETAPEYEYPKFDRLGLSMTLSLGFNSGRIFVPKDKDFWITHPFIHIASNKVGFPVNGVSLKIRCMKFTQTKYAGVLEDSIIIKEVRTHQYNDIDSFETITND